MDQEHSHFARTNQPMQPVVEGIQKRPLTEGESLEMTEYYFEAGVEEAGHFHKTDEVTYVIAGEFDVQIGLETRRLRAGDAYTLPAGAVHTVRCIADGSYVVVKLR